jgi:hypothetical protein
MAIVAGSKVPKLTPVRWQKVDQLAVGGDRQYFHARRANGKSLVGRSAGEAEDCRYQKAGGAVRFRGRGARPSPPMRRLDAKAWWWRPDPDEDSCNWRHNQPVR